MQAWQARMFERGGSRYLIVGTAFLVALLTVVLIPAVGVVPAGYYGLNVGQYVRLIAVTDACALLGFGTPLIASRGAIRSLLRWAKNRESEAYARARAFAFDGPRRVAVSAFATGPLIIVPIAGTMLIPRHHTTALDWAESLVACEAAVLFAVLNMWFTLDALMHPIRTALGGPPVSARRTSLVARLALMIPAVVLFTALAVGLLATTRARAGAGHLLVVDAIAAGCFALIGVIVGPLFASGVLGPFQSLARATRAIAAGNFDTRVPVVATDELGRLATSFNQMLEELQDSRIRIAAASDDARRRVERDLHDGAQQRLVLLKLKLGVLARDPTRTELISEIGAELDEALAELRDLARGIYPQLLETDGLRGAMAEAVERAALGAVLDCDGIGRYPPELEAAVYFCCLEALQNAAKHAGEGAHATVRLAEHAGQVSFEIADDGAGYDMNGSPPGSGLQNISDRIGALGGRLRIDSVPGRGTTISGTIPVESE